VTFDSALTELAGVGREARAERRGGITQGEGGLREQWC